MTPFQKRICAAFGDRWRMPYWDLFKAVFPPNSKAWNYQSNGGPPVGCMILAKLLKKMGASVWGVGWKKVVYLPRPPGV